MLIVEIASILVFFKRNLMFHHVEDILYHIKYIFFYSKFAKSIIRKGY